MITPRRTRPLRAPDLQSFQLAIVHSLSAAPAGASSPDDRAVLVPSEAAAVELGRTITELTDGAPTARLLTRTAWYARLHARLPAAPSRLSNAEREVLLGDAAREADAAGVSAPFAVRPGLIAEMLAFYDALRRQQRSVNDFERLVVGELESTAAIDRGAARMLAQTRFLVESFTRFEGRIEATDRLDEHRLRRRLLAEPVRLPMRHVVVTVADQGISTDGLWLADFDLLARMSELEQLDVVATEGWLASGFLERVHALLPGIEEERVDVTSSRQPTLEVPSAGDLPHCYFISRDREEEVSAVARRVKTRRREPAKGAVGVVFQRPLPYLYLAERIFGAAAVTFETHHGLPLAAEPYAAFVDLVLETVLSGFGRADLATVLRSPHLRLEASDFVEALAPLETVPTLAEQWAVLLTFLERHASQAPELATPDGDRETRARTAVVRAVDDLRRATEAFPVARVPPGELRASLRRRIEAEVFAGESRRGGVRLVDAAAARYGRFDELHVVGLVDTEWPTRARRSVFYPSGLLVQLGWTVDADVMRTARAEFADLVRLPTGRTRLSTFQLEHDALTAPTSLLEDVADLGLTTSPEPAQPVRRASVAEMLADGPIVPSAVEGGAARWLAMRRRGARAGLPGPASPPGHVGRLAPVGYAVSRVDRYLDCPFKYFCAAVLKIDETADEEPTLTRRAQGELLHEVLRALVDAWQARGHRGFTADDLEDALALAERVVDEAMVNLSPVNRQLARGRLLGSAAGMGLVERFVRLEAERSGEVVEMQVERKLDGAFEIREASGAARSIDVRGIADRVDLLADGSLRVVDYKLGRAPRPGRALQLPIYAVCASQALSGYRDRTWRPGESGYVAFGATRPLVPVVGPGVDPAPILADGQARFVEAVDGIERGELPPRPVEERLCASCGYAAVCRKGAGRDD